MRKRFWLFALLLALCLVLTGCRKTVSAPPAAPGSTFAAAPANDAPATVADFDAALKAAGFIDEDEYDALYLDRFSDDAALYQQLTQDGIVGLLAPGSLDAEEMNSNSVKKYVSYHLEEMYMDDSKLMFPWGDAVSFLVFDSDASAENIFQSVVSAMSADDMPPEVRTVGSATRAEYSGDRYSVLFSLKSNTILAYQYHSDSSVMAGVIRDLGY